MVTCIIKCLENKSPNCKFIENILKVTKRQWQFEILSNYFMIIRTKNMAEMDEYWHIQYSNIHKNLKHVAVLGINFSFVCKTT